MKRWIQNPKLRAACGALAVIAALAGCGGSSSSSNSGAAASSSGASGASSSAPAAASGAALTVESSQQNAITQSFNPYVSTSAASLLGAVSLLYEPLLQPNVIKPGQYYPWLATRYRWANGGKSITFTIRSGVKWSNGTPLTTADVAFTYNLLKAHPDVNTVGLALTGVTSTASTVTLNFATPQYANLQNIAGQVYIVPQAIWSKVGDPGKYVDANPVGSGPYVVKSFTAEGITLSANPNYWGGRPAVSTVQFPTFASASAALSALQTNQLLWGGNFIPGVQKLFVTGQPNHSVWFPPVQTNSLEPNLSRWPTNQLVVRQAISDAIDRTAISQQGEGGLEPPVQNASGLTLPVFQQFLSPSVSGDTLSPHSNIAAARAALKNAGYKIDGNGYFALNGKQVTIAITDPSSFNDYANDDELAAKSLRQAGIDASFVGQSTNAWSADLATGNFQLTGHWSQTSVSPYQLYNDWLNSALATNNRAGNFEGLKDPAIDADLRKLASDHTVAAQQADLAPIEQYVAKNLPVIPTVYGVVFDEYNTNKFSGWPTAQNAYESGSPNAPTNEVVILHLKPR